LVFTSEPIVTQQAYAAHVKFDKQQLAPKEFINFYDFAIIEYKKVNIDNGLTSKINFNGN
jgi:hypothetical protein